MKKSIIIILAAVLIIYSSPLTRASELSYEKVEAMFDDDRLDEADALIKKELKNDRDDPALLALYGEAYRRKGDKNKASKFLSRSISINPEDPMPYFYRGKVFFTMRKFDEADEDFSVFVKKIKPSLEKSGLKEFYISKLHDISYMYFSLKKYEEAKKIIDEVLSVYPEDQIALYNTGIYYYTYESDRPKAYIYFTKADKIDPSSGVASKARYAIEFMRNNPDPRVDPDFGFLDKE